MTTIHTVLLGLVTFQNAYAQWGSGGFGGGWNGFGCGAYLPTIGSECYQPETGKGTVVCVCKYD